MTSSLRLYQFAEAARQAYRGSHCLVADEDSLDVRRVVIPRTLSYQARALNQKTWEIFRRSLIGVLGEHKFDWICHRYREQLNFGQMLSSGSPLLAKHVELFSISPLLCRDVQTRFPEKLKNVQTRRDLTDCIRHMTPLGIIGSLDPMRITGSPGSWWAYFFHDRVLMDKEKQVLLSDVARHTFPSWLERFAKVVVNRELLEEQLIPAPGLDGKIDYYTVYRKLSTGDGLVAYALKPAAADSTLKPLIVFRPSQTTLSNEDAFETYFNDVQPHVGEKGWQAGRFLFQRLMQDPGFRKKREMVSIAGYSLGGAHAQYFLVEHADAVSQAVFYNDPSVSSQVAEQFAQKMRQAPPRSEPLNIQIYRVNEPCNYVGDKHVGWMEKFDRSDFNIQLTELHPYKKMTTYKLHGHRIFDNHTFDYRMRCVEDSGQLSSRLDNTKRGLHVAWYRRMHYLWGRVGHVAVCGFGGMIQAVSWLFSIKILRSTRDPEQ